MSFSIFFAHSVSDQPECCWEPLGEHLKAVGTMAAEFASHFGAGQFARAMGLLHDIGKCSQAYQRYIRHPQDGALKGPDHSTAGAQEACAAYGKLGRLLAFGIAGHHSGLIDGIKLNERLVKTVEDYSGWPAEAGSLPDLAALANEQRRIRGNGIHPTFSGAFFVRMLFSCLVDADFIATERFYDRAHGKAPRARGGVLRQEHLDTIRNFLASHRREDTPVNVLRSQILDHANVQAAQSPGLFTLTVPTGGGKTLTSLSFAAEHALAHGLRRIVYVIPFTSIIEQTAAVFRDDVGLVDAVLEHHSSFDPEGREPASGNDTEREGAAGLAKMRRDTENWDAPIVVTTAVQFFESLFAARTSKARKLHNLARSVIVLDEAQSIPVHLLRPCMAAIDELARNYGASVVLCTATQPALRVLDEALPQASNGKCEGLDIPDHRELAPHPAALYSKLRRVRVEWLREPVCDEAVSARFANQPQMLCIVNSRAHARELFGLLREQGQEGAAHLTTLMCARHRRQVLARLCDDLKKGRPVRLVATSLIEAGVDISFPEVWRAVSGLSSIAQAAGRCNRNGELGPLGEALGRTVVFEPAGHRMPDAIKPFYQAAREVLKRNDDPLALEAVREYYRWLYWAQGYKALDRAHLAPGETLEIMRAIKETTESLDFPFAKIARAFRLIDEVMDPIIVPFDDDAHKAINELRFAELPPAGVQRRLQQYVVPVPAKLRADWLAKGVVEAIRPDDYGDRFIVLAEERPGELPPLYDLNAGLQIDGDPAIRSAENNIF
ncbi:CRISPR-associated endonuclease Cas3'' [Pedomonas mirosovicensis]|uniref:CRISPR-associated endonuclease Cas3'' n=1 Tax=Pedomonas mirosovicensis TaxID=2908641 RepID=UPI0021685C02|nr:CRISPR-associated endonuclease Cas3'' [Pedomonas mirosovicensis]MCH8686601.1 CRISPR-associated endonuclease Cas3'' [Pedomonas mirosovicensis]